MEAHSKARKSYRALIEIRYNTRDGMLEWQISEPDTRKAGTRKFRKAAWGWSAMDDYREIGKGNRLPAPVRSLLEAMKYHAHCMSVEDARGGL